MKYLNANWLRRNTNDKNVNVNVPVADSVKPYGTVHFTLGFSSFINTMIVMLTCRSSTSLVHRGKTLELSPRNLARYAVISPATMLKSLIFLERMSWMISRKPFPNSSGEEPSSGLAPRSTRILSSASVMIPTSAYDLHNLRERKEIKDSRVRPNSKEEIYTQSSLVNAPLKPTLLKC